MPPDSSRERSPQRDEPSHELPHYRGGADAGLDVRSGDAWPAIDAILTSGEGGERLPNLAERLDDDGRRKLSERLTDLRKFSGDVLWATMLAAGSGPAFTLWYVNYAARPPTASKIRADLRRRPGAELAPITGRAFTEMRALLPGTIADELPNAVRDVGDLAANGEFVRWLVESMPAATTAHLLATRASATMAATLDREGLWGWVDALVGAQGYDQLPALWASTTDATAKARLAAKLGPMAADDADTIELGRANGAVATRATTDASVSAAELTEAVGNAGAFAPGLPAIRRAIRTRHATPEQAVRMLGAQAESSFEPAAVMAALLEVPDVGRDHVLALWSSFRAEQRLPILTDDEVRRGLRKRLGKAVALEELVGLDALDAATLHRDEALRRWFFESTTPRSKLWFAASGTPAECAKACRILRAEGIGLAWALELGPGADPAYVRVLANNCGDPKVAAHLRASAMREFEVEHIDGGTPEQAAVTGGARSRLDESIATAPPEELIARLADLNDRERAVLAQDLDQVARILARLPYDELPRALALLDLTFGAVVGALPRRGYHRGVVEYLRTRPVAEEHLVTETQLLLEPAVLHVHPDPLLTLPSLVQPKRLAHAIELVPALVERMMAGSEPGRALRLLDHPLVRAKAAPYLAANPDALDGLPRLERLPDAAQEAFDRLGAAVRKAPDAGGAAATIADMQAGTYDDSDAKAEARAQVVEAARAQQSLAGAIGALAGRGHVETADALAIVEAFKAQVPTLIADTGQWPSVAALRDLVGLMPMVAFPDLSFATLARAANTRRWMFEDGDAFLLLQYFARDPGARVLVAVALHDDEPGARAWLGKLPRAAGLTDREEDWLDELAQLVKPPEVLRLLFEVRFGFPVNDTFSATQLHAMYATLARLPDGHVQAGRIQHLERGNVGAQASGLWWGPTGTIAITNQDHRLEEDDVTPDRRSWMTRQQVTDSYGFDDAQFAAQVAAGHFEEQATDRGTEYRIAQVSTDRLTATMLHEVGHAVDEILGSHTELIFGLAGWRQHAPDDFDTIATLAGGWDKVAADDKPAIAQAWRDATFSGRAIKDLVTGDHPALAARYEKAGVGVVADARAGTAYDHRERVTHGDHVFVRTPGAAFCTLPLRTAQVAPSDYSLNAPAEYFAECYVEYYRDVDGSPEGQRKKGGALPTWIKQWFDAHVDRVRFDPRRVKPQG